MMRSVNHDYVYYPVDWTDEGTRKWYVDNHTRWYDVTGVYNFDKYWHIEQNPSL